MELFNQKKALDFILRTAQEKKVSQSKLVEGIYDYSHFNRMCNGKEKINMEVVLLCARKLDINLDEFVRRSSDQDIAFSTLKNEFKFLTMIQNYEEILIFL